MEYAELDGDVGFTSSSSDAIQFLKVQITVSSVSSEQGIRKIFRKTNISYPLIRTRTCAYQGIRNVSFSGKRCVQTK